MMKQKRNLMSGKKLMMLSITTIAALVMTGCASSSQNVEPVKKEPLSVAQINSSVANTVSMLALDTDERTLCSIEKNGINNVVSMAKLFNAAAIEKGLEFRRLNVNNSDLIASVEEAMKTGATMVNPMHFKGKKKSKTKLETNYAAQRACKFAVTALTQAHEGKSTWRLAVPGDGFKY